MGNGTLLIHLFRTSINPMGMPYSITVLIGLAFVGAALLIFFIEAGRENLAPRIGGLLVFIAAAVALYYGVEAFLRP